MPALPDVVMPHLEAGQIQIHEEVKERIQKPARVLGRKCVGGLDRNQPDPQERGKPGFD
jgi:hypothetical protein